MRFLVYAALSLTLAFGGENPKAPIEKPKPAVAKPSFDKVAMEAYIRHLLAVIPEVQIQIDDPKPSPVPDLRQFTVHMTYGPQSQEEVFYLSRDGRDIIRGYVYNLKQNPFQEDLDKLSKIGLAPSFGTAGAPVVIVEFSDFECPMCKEEAKVLRQNLTAAYPKEVRFYFKNFPLEQLHPWAKPAAIAGQCVFRQNPKAFWEYHDWIFEHQADITAENLKDKVLEFAQSTKDVDGMQLGRCLESKATESEVDASIALGKSLGINATPTLFINGRRLVGNIPWQNLQQIINLELNYQKSAQNAGEKCCDVRIGTPLNK